MNDMEDTGGCGRGVEGKKGERMEGKRGGNGKGVNTQKQCQRTALLIGPA